MARSCFPEISQLFSLRLRRYISKVSRKRFHAELNSDECAASLGSFSSSQRGRGGGFHHRPLSIPYHATPSRDPAAPVKAHRRHLVSLGRAASELS